jgi:hypothetical protein
MAEETLVLCGGAAGSRRGEGGRTVELRPHGDKRNVHLGVEDIERAT